mgnify:CR=1 FL=1
MFFLPLILILILRIKSFFFKDTDLNILDRRHKVANRVANKRLKNAHECIKNENFEGFFEEIEKSLWGYFAHKFKVQIADLSKESIESYFNDFNVFYLKKSIHSIFYN